MYWLISILVIAIIMGVLQVTTGHQSAILFNDASGFYLTDNLQVVLIAIGCLLALLGFWLSARHTLQSARQFEGLKSANTYAKAIDGSYGHDFDISSISKFVSVLKLVPQILVGAALLIISAIIALNAQFSAYQRSLKQPMRVQAVVDIRGLSDGVFDPSTGQGYRQLAVISSISPLDNLPSKLPIDKNSLSNKNTVNKSPNQNLTDDNIQNPWQNSLNAPAGSLFATANGVANDKTIVFDTPLIKPPQPFTVLLSAYPKSFQNTANSALLKDNQLAVLNTLAPNQQVVMELALSPVDGTTGNTNNASQNGVAENSSPADVTGFDSARWLKSRHINATAQVLSVKSQKGINMPMPTSRPALLKHLDALRWELRQHFLRGWHGLSTEQQQARAVVLSLLTGDRALISAATKADYQFAGISHLLAISGSHVLFLAVLLAALMVSFMNRFAAVIYRFLPRWQVRWLTMIATAFLYAAFTGFDVPAARTAWMLVAVGAVRLTLMPVSTIKVLVGLAILMAWFDPFVLWQAGYWLSFTAVALLLIYEQTTAQKPQRKFSLIQDIHLQDTHHNHSNDYDSRYSSHELSQRSRFVSWRQWFVKQFIQLLKLQSWLFVALLPISLLLFDKVSLWGLFINLFAIGLYGMVIVPLNLLAGLCYLITPTLADLLWHGVNRIVEHTHLLIHAVTNVPVFGNQNNAWIYSSPNLGVVLIIGCLFVAWLLPKGMLSRWLSLPAFIMLLILSPVISGNKVSIANNRVMSTDIQSPTVIILPTSQSYISAVAIKSANKQNWLILADYRTADTIRYQPLNVARLTDTLQHQLGQLDIKTLQGVIIQTPLLQLQNLDGQDSNNFAKNKSYQQSIAPLGNLIETVATLNERLPIGLFWQAGASLDTAVSESLQTTKPLPITACQVGQYWQSNTKGFKLAAMTGWAEVSAPEVSSCVIAVTSAAPIKIYQFSMAKNSALLTTANQPIIDNRGKNKLPYQLIIDASTHRHLWQLYEKICRDDEQLLSLKKATLIAGKNSQFKQSMQQTKNLTFGEVVSY